MKSTIYYLWSSIATFSSFTSAAPIDDNGALAEHVNNLFRSNFISMFSSQNEYEQQYSEFIQTNTDSNSPEYSISQFYVLVLQNNCSFICHDAIRPYFSEHEDSYSIVDATNGLAFTSAEYLDSIIHNNDIKDYIVSYAPMLPEVKLDDELMNMCTSDTHEFINKEDNKTREFRLRLIIAPLNIHHVNSLHSRMLTHHRETIHSSNTYKTNSGNNLFGINSDGEMTSSTSTTSSSLWSKQNTYDRHHTILVSHTSKYKHRLSYSYQEIRSERRHAVVFKLYEPDGSLLTDNTTHCDHVQTLITQLASYPEVQYIERDHDSVTYNRWARGLCQSGSYDNAYISNIGNGILNGSGEVIGVTDTGIDMSSCYFYDPDHPTPYNTLNTNHRKVIYYETFADKFEDSEGHGTHVAGSAAGYSYFDYLDPKRYNGMAYESKISFFDIGTTGQSSLTVPSNIGTDIFQHQYLHGARILTNSWGNENSNSYDSRAVDVDKFMNDNPDALVLFAAGNEGVTTGTTTAQYNSVGSPGTCKNCLTVGASLDDHNAWLNYNGKDAVFDYTSLADFSSKGPTADGRLKPDLTAPGWWIPSAGSAPTSCPTCSVDLNATVHCTLKSLRGTSMSTPITAGIAVLIRQYFLLGYYPSGLPNAGQSRTPTGALLKAMLIASTLNLQKIVSADPSTSTIQKITTITEYPSVEQGYGRIQVGRVLQFGSACSSDPLNLVIKQGEFPTNGATQTQTFRSTIGKPIRVVLTWTDKEGVANGAVMVNTLQLSVTDGTTTFSPYTSPSNKYTSTGTVLVIDIPNPSTNTYTATVTVVGSLGSSPQTYSLVITCPDNVVTAANVNSDPSLTETKSESKISDLNIKFIIGLTILAFLLLIALMTIYWNDRKARKAFEAEMTRRKSIARSRSNSHASMPGLEGGGGAAAGGHMQTRRGSAAPNSRRPSLNSRRPSTSSIGSPERRMSGTGASPPSRRPSGTSPARRPSASMDPPNRRHSGTSLSGGPQQPPGGAARRPSGMAVGDNNRRPSLSPLDDPRYHQQQQQQQSPPAQRRFSNNQASSHPENDINASRTSVTARLFNTSPARERSDSGAWSNISGDH